MAKDDIVDAAGEGKPSSDAFVTGIVVFTTIALLVGFFIIEHAWNVNYERGILH